MDKYDFSNPGVRPCRGRVATVRLPCRGRCLELTPSPLVQFEHLGWRGGWAINGINSCNVAIQPTSRSPHRCPLTPVAMPGIRCLHLPPVPSSLTQHPHPRRLASWTLQFSSGTGQFTQLVWQRTYMVGCAIGVCPDGVSYAGGRWQGRVYVCMYWLPGKTAALRGGWASAQVWASWVWGGMRRAAGI